MTKPIAADNKPNKVTLEKDKKYFFCACGRSKKQPYCDGSHAGTGLNPKPFVADADGDKFLCMCKQTANPPYCDGSHKSVGAPDLGSDA